MSSSTQKKLLGVSGGSPGNRYWFLFDALRRLYPVEFQEVDPRRHDPLDGLIVLDGDVEAGLGAASRGTPAYVVVEGAGERDGSIDPVVRFGGSASLEACLRNQVMADRNAGVMRSIRVQAGDEVLASRGGQPAWVSRPTARGACQLIAASPPALAQNEFLFQHLNGERFFRLLPLLNFLRGMVREMDWQSPPSRACFVIDDPSFYWPSYGFLNYSRLAEHARQHDYFVSIASIPLDSWWVNRAVAATFRSGDPRLSVLIHGNNHTSRELLSRQDGTASVAAVAQALCRMERLQNKHSIPVLKIMVAPHGAIDHALFPHLLDLGYEAALVTTELLARHNPQTALPPTLGMDKSEILGGGLPVIPRIMMSPDWKNDAVLAVFLRQPIIIAGHHQDAQDNLEAFAEIVRTVNVMGRATWSDMRGVLQANYLQKMDGDLLNVRMYSRRVTVAVPPGVRRVCVERPWLGEGRTEKIILGSDHGPIFTGAAGVITKPLPVSQASTIDVMSEIAHPLHFSSVAPPGVNPWPFARKILMEMRDRLSPALPFLVERPQWIRSPS